MQEWIREQSPGQDEIFSPEFILSVHREFYAHVPESLRLLKNEKGEVIDEVIPGEWRSKEVVVGRHPVCTPPFCMDTPVCRR